MSRYTRSVTVVSISAEGTVNRASSCCAVSSTAPARDGMTDTAAAAARDAMLALLPVSSSLRLPVLPLSLPLALGVLCALLDLESNSHKLRNKRAAPLHI